jgi:hypothetical protein
MFKLMKIKELNNETTYDLLGWYVALLSQALGLILI